MKIEVCADADPKSLNAIAAGLEQHAAALGIEPRNVRALFATVRDDEGNLIGGLSAVTVWGWLHVKELWVAEASRGSDIGTELMNSAEREARERGCHHALLDTFDFQAQPFYEKLGYTVFGQLADFPRGHTRFFMTKAL